MRQHSLERRSLELLIATQLEDARLVEASTGLTVLEAPPLRAKMRDCQPEQVFFAPGCRLLSDAHEYPDWSLF